MKSNRLGVYLKTRAMTLIEILIAFMLLSIVLLPIFGFLTNSVADIDKFYAESVAISRAKFIMDTLMFQMPFKLIKANKSGEKFCRFNLEGKIDECAKDGLSGYLSGIMPMMFTDKYQIDGKSFMGYGEFEQKGFKYLIGVKVVDLHDGLSNPLTFAMPNGKSGMIEDNGVHALNELTARDYNGNYNLMKKIVLQIKWSDKKDDPNKDRNAKSLFLVGFKSDLEG